MSIGDGFLIQTIQWIVLLLNLHYYEFHLEWYLCVLVESSRIDSIRQPYLMNTIYMKLTDSIDGVKFEFE